MVLTGTITADRTLNRNQLWLLRGPVVVGDGATATTLTIEAGTRIYAEPTTDALLVIQRGSKLMAEGTREAPIVFTSSRFVSFGV